jgi:integrase
MDRRNFTKHVIEAIEPEPGRRITIHDTKVEGLILRVEPSGRKSFSWLRKGGGKVQFKRIGSFPDFTVEQARGKASEHNAALAKWAGDDFHGESPFERRLHLTLGQVLDHYIEHHVSKFSKNPARAATMTRWQFNKYLADWKDRQLVTIKQKDIRELHTRVMRGCQKPVVKVTADGQKREGQKREGKVTANRQVEFLRTIFYHAISGMGWKGINPATAPRKNKINTPESSRTRYLNPEEAQRLMRQLRTEPNRDLRDYVLLSLLTGARRGDVLSMRWDALNYKQEKWTLARPMKSRESYDLILPPQAIELLKERSKTVSGEFVFPSHSKSGHLQNLKKPWKALLTRAKIREFRMHDLRRTLGSWMASRGVSLLIIGQTLGHKSYASTEPYARLQKESVRQEQNITVTNLLTEGKEAES